VPGSEFCSGIIVDGYPIWRSAVERMLADLNVVVRAHTSECDAGVRLVEEHRPDLLVTDLHLPRHPYGGAECIRRSLEILPALKAVVLSASHDTAQISVALRSGASAYVTKSAEAEDFASAVRQAFQPSLYLAAPRLAREGAFMGATPAARAGLTARESEIMSLAAQGLSNASIARQLWVTEPTVKFHLSNTYRKLGVSNRTAATHWLTSNGFEDELSSRAVDAAKQASGGLSRDGGTEESRVA